MKNILVTAFFFLSIFSAGCRNGDEHEQHVQAAVTYTCPMHPQIVQDHPGSCPICGMDLVPVDKLQDADFLTLGESQIALANITFSHIDSLSLSDVTRLNGKLVVNPNHTTFISSRIAGRIDRLMIRETGVAVVKGQPLFSIYSEELAALQQEFLVATAQEKAFPTNQQFKEIAKGARQKLLLYGQTEAQLNQLVQNNKVNALTTYQAPRNGVISALSVVEGQYVSEGGDIMQLEDYSSLWVQAEIYPSEIHRVKPGQQVQVVVSGYENNPQPMTIELIEPSLENGSQVMKIRGQILNPNRQWQAGQNAVILLTASREKRKEITLPVDAVIRDSRGALVWIVTDSNHFTPRMVETGEETPDQVVIRNGLTGDEKVVRSGAYLLYSEYILKKGINPLHHH